MTGTQQFNGKVVEVPPIEDTVDKDAIYQTVTERYFVPRYCVDPNGRQGEDLCVLYHSNKICLVTLAPSHPVVSEQKRVVKVDFDVSGKLNRLENKATGKGKKGAQFLQAMSVLCVVECDDGSRYKVFSCLTGKLVEVNERLVEQPQLVAERPQSEGFVAIVLPNFKNWEQQRNGLLTEAQYQEHLRSRPSRLNNTPAQGESSDQ
ncbi:protein Abitram [Bacillus rossius redtenbacheri]|uniref:protein Abitram n=1 Tax=Bacillus rossius redtenbacheri TaxID=93214 RepID=UPI002FDED5BC